MFLNKFRLVTYLRGFVMHIFIMYPNLHIVLKYLFSLFSLIVQLNLYLFSESCKISDEQILE